MAKYSLSKGALPDAILSEIRALGKRLKIARKRRRESLARLAERAYISEPTLMRIESGDARVSFASYVSVLWALGLQNALKNLADPEQDAYGKQLAEQQLPQRIRQTKVDNDYDF